MTQSLPPKSLVLYADDDPDDRMLIREAFEHYAHSVDLKVFRNGVELLQYINKAQAFEPLPCLIILDINMPLMDGKEVLQCLRNMPDFEDVPIVLFSTSNQPSEMDAAKSFNAGFITKPLYSEQMYQIVDKMIDYCADDVKRTIRRLR